MPLGWVAGATALAGVVGAVGASNAASDQASAARNAQNISQQQYQDTVSRNAPFTNAGYGALSNLDYLLGVGPQNADGTPAGASSASPTAASRGGGYAPYLGSGGGLTGLASGHDMRTGSVPGASSASPNMTATQGMGPIGGSGLPINPAAGGASSGTSGGSATGGYGSLLKPFDVSDWQNLSPAYNFQLRQGQQGVLNADTSGKGALSGAAYKDLIDYNQNAANTSFNSAFNQYQTQQGNIYSRLAGIAQMGQASANNTGQQGTALAGQAAQSATNIGTAQAGGAVGVANAIGGAASSVAPWLQYGAGGSGGTGGYGSPNSYGSGFTFSDYGAAEPR